MFTQATKEAIKVGLAVGISIMIAFCLGWEKSYWSVIAVFVVAANETYAHAIAKGGNRILGTLIGVVFAIFLLAMFPQDHLLFTLFLTLFLAFCVFMEPHKRFGYAFKMSFTVCVIIACVGGFNSDNSFTMAILRTQETVLGIVVYSLVFRIIWPKKTEDTFFEIFAESVKYNRGQLRILSHQALQLPIKSSAFNNDEKEEQLSRLNKLNDILDLSLSDSPKLAHEKSYWRLAVKALFLLEMLLADKLQGKDIEQAQILAGMKMLTRSLYSPKSIHSVLHTWCTEVQASYPNYSVATSQFNLPAAQRAKNAAKAVSIFLTCLAMWVYMPVPGGYLMPMLGAIFANVLAALPHKVIKFTVVGTAIWGIVFIAQYVLIMPALTEAWQLAGLYSINAFIIWKLSEKPGLEGQKALAGNLSVMFPMAALQLTPSYSIVTPVIMLVLLFITLGVSNFYSKLFILR